MDDNLDRANDENGASLAQALKHRKPEGPVPTGRCLWCGDIVGDNQRWCDSRHRDRWDAQANHLAKTRK